MGSHITSEDGGEGWKSRTGFGKEASLSLPGKELRCASPLHGLRVAGPEVDRDALAVRAQAEAETVGQHRLHGLRQGQEDYRDHDLCCLILEI